MLEAEAGPRLTAPVSQETKEMSTLTGGEEALLNRPVRCWKGEWSGRWDSNPRRPAWEAGILPLNYARVV